MKVCGFDFHRIFAKNNQIILTMSIKSYFRPLFLTAACALVASCQTRNVEWVSTTFENPWQAVSVEELSEEPADAVIEIDQNVVLGEIEGFGSCFNELGWASLSMLTQEERDGIFRELYTPQGANFTMGRMPVGANDFSLDYYKNDYRCEDNIYSKSEEEIVAYYTKIGEKARSLGLLIPQTHGKLNGLHFDDPAFNEALMKNMKIDILATAAIGAPVCVIHTISSIYHGPDADPEMMQRLNYEMFTGLLPYAKEKGVKIATETFGDANCAKFCCLDYFGGFDAFMEG